MSYRNA
ncbi:unnamed protein product, partial [Allacma fusca]